MATISGHIIVCDANSQLYFAIRDPTRKNTVAQIIEPRFWNLRLRVYN